MADATARFAIVLDANAGPAENMAAALERLRVKIQQDTAELARLQAALKNLQQGTSVNIEAQKALQTQITAKKGELAAAQEQYIAMGGTFQEIPKATAAASAGLGEVAGAATAVGGPVGGLAARGQQLTAALGKGGVAGAALALVAVLVIVLGAAVAATVAIAAFALRAADAARSAGILRDAAAGSAKAGAELGAVVSRLARHLATPREELEGLANDLARTGLSGRALELAFGAIAMTSAVMGNAAGSALQGIVDRSRMAKRFLVSALDLKGTGLALQDVGAALAKRLGISVQSALAALYNGQVKLEDGLSAMDDAVKAKFGAAAARQLLAFPVQIAKARENLTRLFAGVNIEPFLQGLARVLSLLDETSITGKALKAIFETLLNPLFAAIGEQGGMVRTFFQGMVIAALIVAINLIRLRNSFRETFGGAKGDILSVRNALKAGEYALYGIVVVVAMLTALFVVLALVMGLVALPFILAGATIAAVIYGIVALAGLMSSAFHSAFEGLRNLDLATLGWNLVTGFVNALFSGAGLVATAAANLARSALSAIKSTLGIASPSKEAGKLAGFTAQGFSDEIDASAPGVQASMSDAFTLPSGGSRGSSAAAAAAPAGARSFTWTGDLYIGDRKALKDPDLEADVAAMFERMLGGAGLAPST